MNAAVRLGVCLSKSNAKIDAGSAILNKTLEEPSAQYTRNATIIKDSAAKESERRRKWYTAKCRVKANRDRDDPSERVNASFSRRLSIVNHHRMHPAR